jgi:hypothetical protein
MTKTKRLLACLVTMCAGVLSANAEPMIPQWEVNGFPITPLQSMVLQPTKNMQESIPPPASPRYRAIIIVQGNGRIHTVQFDVATGEEQQALVSALIDNPELAARIRGYKNILFVDGYDPLNVDLK